MFFSTPSKPGIEWFVNPDNIEAITVGEDHSDGLEYVKIFFTSSLTQVLGFATIEQAKECYDLIVAEIKRCTDVQNVYMKHFLE